MKTTVFRRDKWKVGIAIAGILLFLVLVVWVPVSAGAYEGASGLATPVTGTVQATPTVDATVTALNKEKLTQEIQQLKYQNEQLKNQNAPDFFGWLLGWLRTNAAILLSTLVIVIGGPIGLWRWFKDRRAEREKQAEERFQKVVEGLGSDKEEVKVGAAILLRTFVQLPYKRFYSQAFDLAVAHLRLLARTQGADPTPSEQSRKSKKPKYVIAPNKSFLQDRKQTDLTTPSSFDSLSHALTLVFRESLPLAREWREKHPLPGASFTMPLLSLLLTLAHYVAQVSGPTEYPPLEGRFCIMLARLRLAKLVLESRMLDAADIQLDKANLVKADLRYAWLEQASFQEAKLNGAKFVNAHLKQARFIGAKLTKADLTKADLTGAYLSGADLTGANLTGADLTGADLTGADLTGADLTGADLQRARLHQAIVTPGQLSKAKNVAPPDQPASIKQPSTETLQVANAEKTGTAPTRNQQQNLMRLIKNQSRRNAQPAQLATKTEQTNQKPEPKEHTQTKTTTDTNKPIQGQQ